MPSWKSGFCFIWRHLIGLFWAQLYSVSIWFLNSFLQLIVFFHTDCNFSHTKCKIYPASSFIRLAWLLGIQEYYILITYYSGAVQRVRTYRHVPALFWSWICKMFQIRLFWTTKTWNTYSKSFLKWKIRSLKNLGDTLFLL